MRRRRYMCLFLFIVILYGVYAFFGVDDYIHSKSFEKEFDYPLNMDIKPLINEVLVGKKPSVKPINYYPYKFLTNSGKCRTVDKLDLFIAVKSAMNHFENRMAIRETYGQENTLPGRAIKILFFVGVGKKSELQRKIDTEMAQYKDIIQMNFLDTYFNNTVKTVMSLRWVYKHCSTADFYLFTDDDMYISVRNLIEYVESMNKTLNDHLYAGYMFESGPQRFMASKWRVGVNEYPWDRWPPYITAGAFVLSKKTMKVLYVASLFVKHFRFDDIYLGIIAKKAGVNLTHCDRFYFYKQPYTKEDYKDVIASHGYQHRGTLVRVWNEQNNF